METKLSLITEIAKRSSTEKINNVAYLLNVENLGECYDMLHTDRAVGIDGISVKGYGENLEVNLKDVVRRMKQQAYRPQAVRRVYIPKANGKKRPLGIPTTEDKVVQIGITRILEAIYEVDFLDCSYGFRPQRSCHQALESIDKIIMTKPITTIIDADIKGFFDNVDHEWMMKFLGHRISDTNLLRLIARFLKSGYIENGNKYESTAGTPQGGIISPILANVYLHYVVDLWIERVIKRQCRGIVAMVRYADDFVICVQYREEAEVILQKLQERLKMFNLTLAEDKTRLITFGRKASREERNKGNKPATFNFLGFTHYIGTSRKGHHILQRKTDSKKLRTKLKEMDHWLKEVRHTMTMKELWENLTTKLEGHFRYFGVSGNHRWCLRFYRVVHVQVRTWLNKRSQKKSFTWDSFNKYLKQYPLPRPRIYHNFYTLFGYAQ